MADKKLYDFKDHPDHQAQLPAWRDKWIAIALSTVPMDDNDRAQMWTAMNGLYAAADLEVPTRGSFVISPIVGAIAAGISAGVWWARENPDRHAELFGSKLDDGALGRAVRTAATTAVTSGWKALGLDWRGGTSPEIEPIIGEVERAVVGSCAPLSLTEAGAGYAADSAIVRFLLACASRGLNFSNGGNMWAGWVAYLSFFRHIAKLDLPIYEKFQHYENAAIYGSYRFMHKRFWIVSDRPCQIHKDDQNRPHNDNGPQLQWRDGWATYYVHGVRVPPRVVEAPENITWMEVRDENNAEVRRVMLARYGEARYLRDAGATLVHEDEFGQLYRIEIPDDEPLEMVRVINSTPEPVGTELAEGYVPRAGRVHKVYTLRVQPGSKTAQEAVASTWRYPDGTRVFPKADDYRPVLET